MNSGVGDAVRERVRLLAACALMTALLAVMSWVSVPLPMSPVPVTLQTLAVFLAGGLLGPRWGVLAVVAYLLLGIAGVPVFAGAEAGPGVLAGPKGGYLVGFVPAAALVGAGASVVRGIRRPGFRVVGLTALLVVAAAVVYAVGVAWLMVVTGLDAGKALMVGVVPFLPGEILKLAAAVGLLRALESRLRFPLRNEP